MDTQFGFGAGPSKKDPRTIKHRDLSTLAIPFIKGGYDYNIGDIENQHTVGICTAISLIQNREKANGKKYSPEFQYLLQKKYYDLNWTEGSSILNALKVGTKYGFLPIELWTHTTEADRILPYWQYIDKVRAIPDEEIQRLISLCTDKLPGYAFVDPADSQAIAKAIQESEAGVLCRYDVGSEWYSPSWLPADINPLKKPNPATSGHAINMGSYDYTNNIAQVLNNTWGTSWNKQGNADIIWSNYSPTEVWAITTEPVITHFGNNLMFGMMGDLIKNLQLALKLKGYFSANITGYFGLITLASVKAFQRDNHISPVSGFVGPITRTKLNEIFKV